MDKVYPFSTFGRAIAFYRFQNPARQKFTNIYEPDKGGYDEDFSGEAGRLIFAAIANAIARILRVKTKDVSDCFIYWHIALRDTDRGIEFIADCLNLPTKQVWKNIHICEEEIANILIQKEILDPHYRDNAKTEAELRKQAQNPN